MKRWVRAAALALAALWIGLIPCSADSLTLMGVGMGVAFPLNIAPNAAAAYGLRLMSSSYAGKDVNVRRGSDQSEEDIGFAGPNMDTVTGMSFCADGTVYADVLGTVTTGDKLSLTFSNAGISGSPITISYTTVGGDTPTTAATGLKAAILASTPLTGAGISATSSGAIVTITYSTSTTPVLYPTRSMTGAATEALTVASDCFVDTWYDQGGNGYNQTESTAANQPQLAFNATPNGRAALLFNGSQFLAGTGNVGTGAYPQTYSAVFTSGGGGGFEPVITIDTGTDGAQLQLGSTGSQVLVAAAGGPDIPISINTFYSAVGVLASAASATIYANGTSATAAPGAIGAAAPIRIAHSTDGFFTNFKGSSSEEIVWLNVVAAPTAVVANQQAYYGTK